MVLYHFVGKKGQLYELKFNSNCPNNEKVGGEHPCSGSNGGKQEFIGHKDFMHSKIFEDIVKLNKRRNTVSSVDYVPSGEDVYLKEIIKDSNFAKTPAVITSSEMKKLDKQKIVYRGVTDVKYSEQFKKGEYFAGGGICGSGIYASSDIEIAKQYTGNNGTIIKMSLSKDAKIIDGPDLRIMQEKFLDDLNEYKRNISQKTDEYNKVNLMLHIMEDPGKFATINGYDAVKYERDGILVRNQILILNRSILSVQDKDINSKEI